MRSSCIAAAAMVSMAALAVSAGTASAHSATPGQAGRGEAVAPTQPGHVHPLAHPARPGHGTVVKTAPGKPKVPPHYPPDLVIAKSHDGPFHQGQHGALYTITVSNLGSGFTSLFSTVTVTDTLPAGLTATSISGAGWSCSLPQLRCTRDALLAPNTQFPPIYLLVDVADNAPELVTNAATLSDSDHDDLAAPVTVLDPTRVVSHDDEEGSGAHHGKGSSPVNVTVINQNNNQNNSSAHNHNTSHTNVKVNQKQSTKITKVGHITTVIKVDDRHKHHGH